MNKIKVILDNVEYIIIKNGGFIMLPKSEYDTPIWNERKIINFHTKDGFVSFDDVIDYIECYYKYKMMEVVRDVL